MEKIERVRAVFGTHENTRCISASPAVIRRLPRYHRYLSELLREERFRVSSHELARMMGVTASQIRQDLNVFGGFGQQGYGYNVSYLREKIGEVLGMNEGFRAVIVGAGNLGRALVSSHMFERRGITRVAMFDVSPAVIGTCVAGIPVLSVDTLEDYCRENKIDIAVLTTPKEAAAEVLSTLTRAGVAGIWNFSNTELHAENPNVIIENIHIGDSLLGLAYAVKLKREEDNADKI